MKRKNLIFCFVIIMFYATFAVGQEGEKVKPLTCQESLAKTGDCPKNKCKWKCINPNESPDKCIMTCFPKPCFEIKLDDCPTDRCQIIKGCEIEEIEDKWDYKKICFKRVDVENLQCGGLAYSGQNIDCCKGMVKRCGVEFFDGSCDMVGKYSVYAAPICLPCGNGICNQFEDRCNCPEDCK